MLSITDNGGFPAPPARFNMAAHVLRHAAALRDKTALRILSAEGSESWSFAELSAAVRGTATGLLRHGLTPGDLVLLRLGNTVDFPVAYLGALAAGLVPVPTAAALTARETARIIDELDPAVILHDPEVPCPEDPRCLTRAQIRAWHDLPPAEWHMGDPERLGYIVYTSGTSGKPSAVMHAHRAIWARQMMFDGWYDLRADDRLCHAGAFNWTYTLGTGLMDPWTMGATALIPAPGTAPGALPALLAEAEATIFAATPGVYRQMMKSGKVPPLPTLRHGLSAGEKLPEATRSAWRDATGTEIYEAYGMSECSTFISACPAHPAAPGTLGRPQPGRRVALLGKDGPVPRGTPGLIAVQRQEPGLMLGYRGAPEQTAERYRGDWFVTGDTGVMDEDGQIAYLGRTDDMMNAGGFRVSPLEVEAVMAGHPQIEAVAAAEVAVRADVTVIAAFYTAPDGPLDEEALHRYAQTSLARYKQPRLYIHVPALPVGANGKLLRRKLREEYEARTP